MSLIVENIEFSYGNNKVLKDISFELSKGVFCCLLGSNGAGKSTLFRCILKLLEDYRGKISIDGKSTEKMSPKEMASRIAYIPQSHAPVFDYEVKSVVLMSTTKSGGIFNNPDHNNERMAMEALDRVGISHLAEKSYTQISGGERQLVLIARALAQGTKMLIMDESTSNLDYGNQMKILSIVRDLAREGYTIIQATHHPDHTFIYADEVIVMDQNKIMTQGTPRSALTKEVIKKIYDIDVEISSLFNDQIQVCIPSKEIKIIN